MTWQAGRAVHVLLTGRRGTVGDRLARHAAARGWRATGWDRARWAPDDPDAAARALDALRPDAVAHLALGDAGWAGRLAAAAAARGLPLVFTSTAMVFDAEPDGPHGVADPRTARDAYGREKVACEDAIARAHPGAVLARLGWQLDAAAPGNNLLAELDRRHGRGEEVRASRRWIPALGVLDDTCAALLDLLAAPRPGVVHLDANAAEAWRFDEVALALARRFARPWRIVVEDGEGAYRHDQRLVGGPVALPPLSAALPALAAAR